MFLVRKSFSQTKKFKNMPTCYTEIAANFGHIFITLKTELLCWNCSSLLKVLLKTLAEKMTIGLKL